MQTYIAFLRGVNISGHNPINMKQLSSLCTSMGFADVRTYIQSGNVIFSAPGNSMEKSVSDIFEKAILGKFGHSVHVIIRTIGELKKLNEINPFLNEEKFNPSRMAVIFLKEKPGEAGLMKVSNVSYPPDKFEIIGRDIFIYCPDGFGRSKIHTNFFENKMDVSGTARNWKTINSIIDLVVNQ